MRREKLNDRFMELSSLLDPGKPPMTDKSSYFKWCCSFGFSVA
ncbi:unnamed protein product [Musa acuminata subsp. malaccensis]|uniref:(wild Malaysian banana) hypothetical protein n=1 Tax=Musa acuminata subsp. malaccensis TaxID=214687 RepID=A0A8D7B2V8_MUSAM|nr:unnamed protein product [Musa acuminata subsp. malaccensis]